MKLSRAFEVDEQIEKGHDVKSAVDLAEYALFVGWATF